MVTIQINTIHTQAGFVTIAITQGLRGVGPFHVRTDTNAGPYTAATYLSYAAAQKAWAEMHALLAD